jgi:hypothetical protein
MFLAYEILSTRLFTFLQIYSQAPTQEKFNADNDLRVFSLPSKLAEQAARIGLVDKFPTEL